MATLVGNILTSHVPAIGRAIAKNLQGDPYWKPFFDGWPPVQRWLEQTRPDVAVMFYNDHGLNFFLDKMPTFAVGAAPEYRNADEGWGIPVVPPFQGEQGLSWHLIEALVPESLSGAKRRLLPWLLKSLPNLPRPLAQALKRKIAP